MGEDLVVRHPCEPVVAIAVGSAQSLGLDDQPAPTVLEASDDVGIFANDVTAIGFLENLVRIGVAVEHEGSADRLSRVLTLRNQAVAHQSEPDDGRGVRIEITEAGHGALREVETKLCEVVDELCGLGDYEVLLSALDDLSGRLDVEFERRMKQSDGRWSGSVVE